MKQVGILTYHRTKNYGALLQSYSLINRLQTDFPGVKFEIIDYMTLRTKKKNLRNLTRTFIKYGVTCGVREFTRNRKMTLFSKSLPLSKERIISDNCSAFYDYVKDKYDVLIVGSDAVFNWAGKVFPTAYLLGEETGSGKKFSYAASAHGLDYRRLTDRQRKYCEKAFDGYTYIGVRDNETERFVTHCGSNAKTYHNCDPAMLLDVGSITPENLKEKLARKYKVDFNRPIILVMTESEFIGERIKKAYGGTHEILSLFVPNKSIKKQLTDLSPCEWAAVFSFAQITVTQYFHATILSLKNNTPVVAVDFSKESDGYEGKIKDLLCSRLGLGEFYFNVDDIFENITWDRIHQVIDKASGGLYDNSIRSAVEAEQQSIMGFEAALREALF